MRFDFRQVDLIVAIRLVVRCRCCPVDTVASVVAGVVAFVGVVQWSGALQA